MNHTSPSDQMNRLTGRWTNGVSVEGYAYDLAGELTNRTDPGGSYAWVSELHTPTNTRSVPTKNDSALEQLLGGEPDTRK